MPPLKFSACGYQSHRQAYPKCQSGRAIQQMWRLDTLPLCSLACEPVRRLAAFDDSPEIQESESPFHARQRLEATLLVSREPISPRKLAQLANLADATQARTLARQLNEIYDTGGHAFRIEEVAGGYMLLSRPQFARWLRKLDSLPGTLHLPQSALETLSIVAYRQPVPRAEIEAIRGIGCDEVLRQLMHQDLVRICGRSEDLGRPYLYGTTKRFLQLFGLKTLDRLPRADWVRQAEPLVPAPANEDRQPSVADSINS